MCYELNILYEWVGPTSFASRTGWAQDVQAESTKLECFEAGQSETPADSHYALFSPPIHRMLQNLTNVD